MRRLNLPIPPGFTISTKACDFFYNNNKKLNKKILKEIKQGKLTDEVINTLEKVCNELSAKY